MVSKITDSVIFAMDVMIGLISRASRSIIVPQTRHRSFRTGVFSTSIEQNHTKGNTLAY